MYTSHFEQEHTDLTYTHSHQCTLISPCSFLLDNIIQIKTSEAFPLFISPQTPAPQSWSVGPAHMTEISLVPWPWPCPGRGTSPCPPSLHTLLCLHASLLLRPLSTSLGTASALFRGCEMICLSRI